MSSLLDQAESVDHFRAACAASPLNAAARAGCSYTLWPDQSLAVKAQAMVGDKAQVVILHPTAEGGMPHTRPLALPLALPTAKFQGIIALPAYFPESRLPDTLRHELVHIAQRASPPSLAPDWTPVDPREIPEHWVAKARLNPDTLAARWQAWESRYVPIPCFLREDKPSLRDIELYWYDRRSGRALKQPPSSFTQRYGAAGVAAMEHPYELQAYSH